MIYAAFYSTHDALKAERVAQERDWGGELVPVPRDLSANCGLALRVANVSVDDVRAALAAAGITPQAAVERE